MEKTEAKKPVNSPPNQHVMDIFIIGLLFFAALTFFDFGETDSQEIPYSEFKQRVRDNAVESILIRGDRISGNYRSAINDFNQFDTTFPPMEDFDLFPLLEENNIEVRVRSAEQSTWMLILINLLPWLLIIGIFMMSRRMLQTGGKGLPGSGVFSFTKSKARRINKEDIKVSFDDIAGLKHAKEDLGEVIDFLRNPDKYRSIGAKIPKGILLIGPPRNW